MAAKGKSYCKAQRNLQGFPAILKSSACEWLLIFLMLIDALLSYVLTKFAYICNLQTPCILCSRLDHLLGKEKHNNYRNLLCTNHRLEISSLVSCYKHNKLVDGNEMCDACLCSFATTNNKPKSSSKIQRLLVGKLRSDSGGNGAHGKLLNRDSIPYCIRTRPCSCCSKPWKTRPNAQGFLQLKSSVNAATKPNIPLPRRLNSRDSLKKMRDKISGSVTLQHPGKTGFNLLSHVGYSKLKITSDSDSEVLLSEEDDDRSLICEKSELKEDFVLQSITQIPLKPHCDNCDHIKPSINFVGSRPSPLESYVQVDVQKPHSDATTFHGLSELNWLPWPANLTANPSALPELISLDDTSFPASNALGLPRANSMEKSKLTDSLTQESTFSCPPGFITLHHDPQVVGKLTTCEETGTNNTGIASLHEFEDHSTLISATVEECPKTDEVVYESTIRNTNGDMAAEVAAEKTGTNNTGIAPLYELEDHSTLISTTVEECTKPDEVVYESAIRNINDDMAAELAAEETGTNNTGISPLNELEDHSTLISTTVEERPKIDEVVYESAIRNTDDDMVHSIVSESSGSDKEQEVFNFAAGQPSETETDIVTNDLKQFPLQNSSTELINQSSSDEGQDTSTSCDDLQEEFASEFNIIRALDHSVSLDSDVESLDGSNVSEIEGENIVDRLKRQVEYDRKCINSLYKELEEERSASEVAASQAMAMITRLQEEKAAMHMEALQYLRMMEEQAEYDVEALEKANEVLNEKEREIQDLETELEFYRANYLNDTIVEIEHEKSHGANGENIIAENDIVRYHEYNGNYSFKSTIVEASKGSHRSFNHQTSSLEFEDEKIYMQICLKSLEDKINKISSNALLARVPNCIDIEEVVNPEQNGEESTDAERSQRNKEQNGPSIYIDKNTCNGTVTPGRFGSEENFPNMKGQISCANKREEVDFLALEHKISDLTGRLEALQADYDFLEHSLNSLRYGEEGLQFIQNIVHQLQELCKLGIRLDRRPGS